MSRFVVLYCKQKFMKNSILSTTILATALLISCTKEKIQQPGLKASSINAAQSTLVFTINSTAILTHSIKFNGSGLISGSVDWGNGLTQSFSSTGTVTVTNIYTTAGIYNASITLSSLPANITDISAVISEITSIEGLQNLSGLKTVNFHHNQLTSLDFSGNPELVEISCYDNNISNLDITKNSKLIYLLAPNNNLSTLDISKNKDLFLLSVPNNQLSNIDLSHNHALNKVSIEKNKLSAAVISQALIDMNANTQVKGRFASFYQTPNAVPFGGAISAMAGLQAREWVITTD